MNLIVVNLIKEYLPYLIAFLLGVVVAWKGCGTSSGKPVTQTVEVEKPIYITEYVDRWQTDTVRFVEKEIVTHYDTVTNSIIRKDTIFKIDTVSIIETWLTEVNKYDTTLDFTTSLVNLKWQNYQNVSEKLKVTHTPVKAKTTWSLGLHSIAGLESDFNRSYKPLFGLGVQTTIKNTYISGSYAYNSDHFIMVGVGRNFINR